MSEEKKPESTGPVVIRKGHVKPPPAGAKIEAPVVETLPPEAGARAPEDRRPMWQRLAEQKAAQGETASPPQPSPATPSRRGGEPRRDRADRRGPREHGGRDRHSWARVRRHALDAGQ